MARPEAWLLALDHRLARPANVLLRVTLCGSAEATREWFRAFAAHSFLACRPRRPGESEHRQFQTAMSAWPSPRINRLGTPNDPAIRFTREVNFGATFSSHIRYGLPGCSPPCTIRPIFRLAPGGFYFQAFNRSVSLPVAGYNYNSD